MRVLVVVSSAGMGGGERVALDLARAARDREVDVRLAAPAGGWVERRCVALGVPFVTWSSGGPWNPLAAFRLARLVRESGPDVVHAHLNAASFQAGWVAGRPVVASVHGLNRAIHYRRADHLLPVSCAAAEHLVRQQPSLASRITVLRNHVDPRIRADAEGGRAWRAALGIPQGSTVLAVVAKLHPNKGQRVAIEAMRALPESFTLALVGEGPDRAALATLVAARGLGARVKLAGGVADPSPVYGAADLILVPSGQESFSLVAAEALSCGVRVLAHDVGGIPEVVEDPRGRVTGLDPDRWARRILERLGEPPPTPDTRFGPRPETVDLLLATYRRLARTE